MKVLIGKTFGIGNVVLSIPMIKSISSIAEDVAVLIGNTPDDYGALHVLSTLQASAFKPRNFRILINPPGLSERFDVAVMAIPFDGRWRNGVDFIADKVVDCRKRPDNIDRLGFDMWKKHEVLYQMENAYELGFNGTVPGTRFYGAENDDKDLVYLGIGYKRDIGGFGLSKHFGNDRFAELICAIRSRHPAAKFVSTGNHADLIQVGAHIMKKIANPEVYRFESGPGLPYAFNMLGRCGSYIGNDTGMMHVAASLGMPTHGLFLSQDLAVKNHPWGPHAGRWVVSSLDADLNEIADYFVKITWGDGVKV